MYPMTQLPPDKVFLPGYQWFDYIRPLNKEDIFVWRPKKEGTELKKQPERREAPLRRLSSKGGAEELKPVDNEVQQPTEELKPVVEEKKEEVADE